MQEICIAVEGAYDMSGFCGMCFSHRGNLDQSTEHGTEIESLS